jgi:hypothetical protein
MHGGQRASLPQRLAIALREANGQTVQGGLVLTQPHQEMRLLVRAHGFVHLMSMWHQCNGSTHRRQQMTRNR